MEPPKKTVTRSGSVLELCDCPICGACHVKGKKCVDKPEETAVQNNIHEDGKGQSAGNILIMLLLVVAVVSGALYALNVFAEPCRGDPHEIIEYCLTPRGAGDLEMHFNDAWNWDMEGVADDWGVFLMMRDDLVEQGFMERVLFNGIHTYVYYITTPLGNEYLENAEIKRG